MELVCLKRSARRESQGLKFLLQEVATLAGMNINQQAQLDLLRSNHSVEQQS
jgi:hypothetical protein